MAPVDSATWQALGLTLTLIGLAASFLVWRRKGVGSGLRGVAWSLLPLAAALTGTLRLLWEIADAVVDWSVRLVFSPIVWTGIILAGVSAVLFVVSGRLRRRSGRSGRTRSPEAATPAVDAKRSSKPAQDDDMAEIEALLKKHGIG